MSIIQNKEDLKNNKEYFNFKVLAGLLPNIIVFAVFVYCYFLNKNDLDAYLALVQEDDLIEWATMWSFLLASIGGVLGVIAGRRQLKKFEWFYAGLALFCFIVAMEEISWGQRFFGFLPPDYFLENNIQQELTVHNVIDAPFRIFILRAILLGYGVILPLLMLIPNLARLAKKFQVIVPPLMLVPSFFLAFYVYKTYPFELTGELVELMMGLSFLFTIIFDLCDLTFKSNKSIGWRQFSTTVGASVIILTLGLGTVNWVEYKTKGDGTLRRVSLTEIEAIKNDFIEKSNQQGGLPFKNHFHNRLYTLVNIHNFSWMQEGKFSSMAKQNGANDRAEYFLDPWNMPYWVMFKSNKTNGRNRFVIYSFGPNRKRDSNDWLIKGDDVGLILFDTY